MTYDIYKDEFKQRAEGVFQGTIVKPEYEKYTKINFSRSKRWESKGELFEEVKDGVQLLHKPLDWILITEPWCGDAAHSVPFIQMMAEKSEMINLQIHMRDDEPHLINSYLTNGGKSIPKLIVRDAKTQMDLFTWGPRPAKLTQLREEWKESKTSEEATLLLQKWYNLDQGKSVQKEILDLIQEKVL